MASENNKNRLLKGALFCLIGATNPTFGSDSNTNTNTPLQKIKDSYFTKCLDLSFITKIQLARIPERRRQLAIQCSVGNWRNRAHIEADARYKSDLVDDVGFRVQIHDIDRDPLFSTSKELGLDNRFQVQRLKTNSKDTTDDGINAAVIDTLDGYTTSSDD